MYIAKSRSMHKLNKRNELTHSFNFLFVLLASNSQAKFLLISSKQSMAQIMLKKCQVSLQLSSITISFFISINKLKFDVRQHMKKGDVLFNPHLLQSRQYINWYLNKQFNNLNQLYNKNIWLL